MDDKSFNIRVPKKWARYTMVAVVTALIVAPLTAIASHSFTDVPDSNTFHADIAWLADAGVTKGCNPPDNTEFCPNDNVTRGQMSAFMHRFAQFIGAADGTPAQADNATTADSATTAGDADTLDSKDSSEFVAASEAPALTGDTITFTTTAVNGVTKIEEVSVTAPSDGFFYVSANSGWESSTETNILTWVQLDNTTCINSTTMVTSISYGYALTTGTMDWTSASFGGPVVASEGAHTLTLCANPFNGNLTPNLKGAGVQVLFTSDGSVNVNTASTVGDLGGASN